MMGLKNLNNLIPEDNVEALSEILREVGERAFGSALFAQIADPPEIGRAGLPVIPLRIGGANVRLAFSTVLMREIIRQMSRDDGVVARLERVTDDGAVEVLYLDDHFSVPGAIRFAMAR